MMWNLPNILTLLNLLSGSIGITLVLTNKPETGAEMGLMWVLIAVFFDFFDGFAARKLNIKSPMGAELDSLADMVSFGVLPGVIMYQMMLPVTAFDYAEWLAFLIPAFSALRLAKFNTDERQSDTFYGLPTPSNAVFISSLPYVTMSLVGSYWVLLAITLIFSLLLIADIRMFALKFSNFAFGANKWKYLAIVAAFVCLAIFRIQAFPMIIVGYIIISFVIHFSAKPSK